VGKQTGIKHTPSLSFVQDTVPDTARTIEDLVAKAREADAAVAAARAGAVPAGDPDPYRQPVTDDDDEEDDEDEADDFELSYGDDDSDDAGDCAAGGPLGDYPPGPGGGARYSRS
jgi:ribosome-binding factor A